MRLLDFNSVDAYVHPISMGGSNQSAAPGKLPHLKGQKLSLTRPEVRVVTEHITMTEFPYVMPINQRMKISDRVRSGSRACSPYMKSERRQKSSCAESMKDVEALSDKASFEYLSPE